MRDPEPVPLLAVRGLKVVLPDGRPLIDDFSLTVRPGEVVVLLGGSGAGKSTFARVLFEPATLAQEGFHTAADELTVLRDELGLVPQRGALFDHLDVRGNLDLALEYARSAEHRKKDAASWLGEVGLPAHLAKGGVPVASLSGGQAQRVAVARALAAGRRLLFLDEPSVGLDPHRVRRLASLIREQCERHALAVVVVTHDVALAAGVADRIYFLDPSTRHLEPLFADDWPGPMDGPGRENPNDGDDTQRARWLLKLEAEAIARIARAEAAAASAPAPGGGSSGPSLPRRIVSSLTAPFGVAVASLLSLPSHLVRRPGELWTVARRVLRQSVLRPLVFYAVVSTLLGYTILYVVSKIGGAGVRPDAGIRLIGGAYVTALAPALSAILYVAASGNATNAWLGSMRLTRQVAALEALGVSSRAYLFAPAWLCLGLGYLVCAALFAAGMIGGGLLLCHQLHVPQAYGLLTSDLLNPRPERVRTLVRAGFLVWIYAWGIASEVVARGGSEKRQADEVTRAMTGSVVACTLWLVVWELATALLLFVTGT
jgi:ABC-type nitrate/sulfonate/bicarbonate transport system ATPase subunit/ABC-type transporter Mla maintaining outer membrane lipid asymmetry permease subunit MlaE